MNGLLIKSKVIVFESLLCFFSLSESYRFTRFLFWLPLVLECEVKTCNLVSILAMENRIFLWVSQVANLFANMYVIVI